MGVFDLENDEPAKAVCYQDYWSIRELLAVVRYLVPAEQGLYRTCLSRSSAIKNRFAMFETLAFTTSLPVHSDL